METKTVKFGLSEKKANKKLKSERGQLLGAVLQGRRYSQSGKQITTSNRNTAGITGKGSKNVNSTYNTY